MPGRAAIPTFRGKIKNPQVGRLAHAGHGVFRPKTVLPAASDAATGIGLSIYFRFVPFNIIVQETKELSELALLILI